MSDTLCPHFQNAEHKKSLENGFECFPEPLSTSREHMIFYKEDSQLDCQGASVSIMVHLRKNRHCFLQVTGALGDHIGSSWIFLELGGCTGCRKGCFHHSKEKVGVPGT